MVKFRNLPRSYRPLRWGLLFLPVFIAGCGGSSGGPGSGVTSPSIAATLAGSGTSGATDGTAATATFNNPVNVAIDTTGNIYVADFDNNRIRKISTGGVVSTLVNQANFVRPFGITLTPDGRLYVTTDGNDQGQTSTTTGTLWQVNPTAGGATLITRNLGRPRGLAALSNTQLVLVDIAAHDVRIFNPATRVLTPLAGLRGTEGSANGAGTAARFNRPYGAAITPAGNILIADQNNNSLRSVTPAGVVTTFAGSITPGYRDGGSTEALFNRPQDVDVDTTGNVYISDSGNHRIRRISSAGIVSTFAGNGTAGFADGEGLSAQFFGQEGLAVTRSGSRVIVADGNGGDGGAFNRVRSLTPR